MPRVNGLVAEQKVQQRVAKLTRDIRNELKDYSITYTDLAKVLNITPQAVSRQFRKGGHITTDVLVASWMLLEKERGSEVES